MRETRVAMPVIAAVAVTRGMLGAGVALLLGDRLTAGQRRGLGWALLVTGAVTTFPLVRAVLAGRER